MAKNRKNQSAAIRFGPALKAILLCLIIGGAGVGYVWQKTLIDELGRDKGQRETRLAQLQDSNEKLRDHLAMLRSPAKLVEHARDLKLGLSLPLQSQKLSLIEPVEIQPAKVNQTRLYAAQPARGPLTR